MNVQNDTSSEWYYKIQLAEDDFTNGPLHSNLALTRRLLSQIDLDGLNCLDLGTQEGVIPVLLQRNGVAKTIAYDRWQLEERIKSVQKAYDVNFDYISGLQLRELPKELEKCGEQHFDLVVFSGVLYHLIDPLGILSLAKSFCRVGGVFVIETAITNSNGMSLHFNAGGKLYGNYANYFLPTVDCLDYFLRMLCLKPLKLEHISDSTQETKRVAILCRVMPEPVDQTGVVNDEWLHSARFERDLMNEYGVDLLPTRDKSDVPLINEEMTDKDAKPLSEMISETDELKPEQHEMMLTLDAKL